MKQYNQIKAKYPGALLLFRVGDFYETFLKMQGGEVIVGFFIQYIVVKRQAGSNQFGNHSFHYPDGIFRVFQLIADGHAVSGTY